MENDKKCVIVYHQADFDGKLSAAILYKKALDEGLQPVLYPYDNRNEYHPEMLSDAGHVWIADISLPSAAMKELADSGIDARWWDHHVTSYRASLEQGYASLRGTRTPGGTGEPSSALLVCRDCYPEDEELLYIAELVSVSDTKDVRNAAHNWGTIVHPFMTGLHVYVGDNVQLLVEALPVIGSNPATIRNLGAQMEDVLDGWRANMVQRAYVVGLNGEECAVMVCAQGKPPMMGDARKNCRYGMTLHREPGGLYSISLHLNTGDLEPEEIGKYDCAAMLQEMFGKDRAGGHKQAAGAHSLLFVEIEKFLFPGRGEVLKPLVPEKTGYVDRRKKENPVLKGIKREANVLAWEKLAGDLRKEFRSGVFPVTVNGEKWNCLVSGVLDGDVFLRVAGRDDAMENNIRISPVPGTDKWEVCRYHVTADDRVEVVTDCLAVSQESIRDGLDSYDFTEAVREAETLKWRRSTGAGRIVETMGEEWSLDVDIVGQNAVMGFPLPDGTRGSISAKYLDVSSWVIRKLSDSGVPGTTLQKVFDDESVSERLLGWTSRTLFEWIKDSCALPLKEVVDEVVRSLTREAVLNIIIRKDNKMNGQVKGVAIRAIRWVNEGCQGPCPFREGGVLERLPDFSSLLSEESRDESKEEAEEKSKGGPGSTGGAGGAAPVSESVSEGTRPAAQVPQDAGKTSARSYFEVLKHAGAEVNGKTLP